MSSDTENLDQEQTDLKPTKRLSARQQKMLEALKAKANNVTLACDACGVGRSTHYVWMSENERYAQAVKDIDESIKDLTESKLLVNINSGNQRAIEYFLDSKAKERGYGHTKRLEIAGVPDKPIQHADISEDKLKEKLKELGIDYSSQLEKKRVD